MVSSRYILPALAFAGATFAQCSGPSITISSSADAQQIASCQTYQGDVIIDSSASGVIAINGVTRITGSLTCLNGTQLTAITSDQLTSIEGTFRLEGLTIMSTLQFDYLQRVSRIQWIGLPALQSLNFGRGVTAATSVYISNTQLNSLDGIELTAVGAMDINNNPYLSSVDVNNLRNITSALSFSANAKGLEISLPNLRTAANLTFRDCASISMPSLATVGGAMGFYSDSISTFSAPNLTQTGGTLAFVACPSLKTLNFPNLVTIGGGFLINDTGIDAITGFPKLQTVTGAIGFAGGFSSVYLPSLKDVRGGDVVRSTSGNGTICTQFANARANGIIKGTNDCTANATVGTLEGNTTSSGSSSSSTKTNAANPAIHDPSAPLTGLAALIAAVLFI